MNRTRTVFKSRKKKSNTLLLLILMVVGVSFSSFVITVNHKLRKKAYTYVNNDKSQYSRLKFDAGKIIVLHGLDNCVVVSSDSVSLEIFNADKGMFEFESSKDTVKIIAKGHSVNNVLLYIPTGSQLVADSCSLLVKGSFDFNKQPSYKFLLHSSKLIASSNGVHTFFDSLSISGSGESQVEVVKFAHIRNLELLNMRNVQLEKGWQIGNLKTRFDVAGDVELSKRGDSVSIAAGKR